MDLYDARCDKEEEVGSPSRPVMRCMAPGCSYTSAKVSVFPFPVSDEKLLTEWTSRLNRSLDWIPIPGKDGVCFSHFEETQVQGTVLDHGSIPTRFREQARKVTPIVTISAVRKVGKKATNKRPQVKGAVDYYQQHGSNDQSCVAEKRPEWTTAFAGEASIQGPKVANYQRPNREINLPAVLSMDLR